MPHAHCDCLMAISANRRSRSDQIEFLRGAPLVRAPSGRENGRNSGFAPACKGEIAGSCKGLNAMVPPGDALAPRAIMTNTALHRASQALGRSVCMRQAPNRADRHYSGNTRLNSRNGRDTSRQRLTACAGETYFHGQQNADRRLPPGGNAGGGHPRQPN